MSFALLLALASSPYPRNDVRLVSVSASGAETVTALDDGMLLLRDAVAWWEQEMLLRAERQAWKDRFLIEHSLVNRTRQITGSPSRQSVTWLHRHRGFAGGVVDRLVEAVMSAQEAAGWALAGLGPLQVRCIESVRYSSADDEGHEDGDEGWHQDEYSVLTAVLTLALSHDLQGGETEVDRGGHPRRAEGMQPGDLLIFRSWDAHRSTPVAPGERHIIVLELWQGPQVGNDAPEGRQAVLEGGLARLCPPALAADASSAALLWFCSRAADEPAAWAHLTRAAELVGGSAYLWELAAAALAIPLLDGLRAGGGAAAEPFARMTAALRRAGFLRTAALVPDVDATPPPGWDEEEDGLFDAGFVDGVDGASVGGFFRQMSRGKGCGFPSRGLDVLRRRMAERDTAGRLIHKEIDTQLRDAVAGHPSLWNAWLELDVEYLSGGG
mmetsp:Transcript_2159/g.6173  ORF Transcript_2159/g.6173 Transcript_2159/m.6173 type:complete len:440 (-) Transcript_2159:33-1352(-)